MSNIKANLHRQSMNPSIICNINMMPTEQHLPGTFSEFENNSPVYPLGVLK